MRTLNIPRVRRLIAWIILVGVVSSSVYLFHFMRLEQEVNAIKAMSWAVAGHTFIVDPGHGGEDPGKVSPSGIFEKDINLAVALKLKTILCQGGGNVILTRETDKALSDGEPTIRERKIADLAGRVKMSENSNADLYIALHCNAFPSSRWRGAQTFYSSAVAGSKELADNIQSELISHLENTTRQPKIDNTSLIFKHAKIPIVNVEMGFLSNSQEEKLLQDPAYQDKMAWAIYSGIVKYLVDHGDKYTATLQNSGKVK